MYFSNLFFLYIFLPALFLAYFIVRNDTYRRIVLTAFSLFFYAFGEPVYVFLMIGLVAVDYGFGRVIGKTAEIRIRKRWLIAAVVLNLAFLCFFKYLGFFIETWNTLFVLQLPVFSLKMPIGISFFTFQTMSYVIDVYRGDAEVQKSYGRLLLYVSFFPQLIAGPIVRYKDIEAQLDNRHVELSAFHEGLFRFCMGLAKKVLIADSCNTAVEQFFSLSDKTVAGQWLGAVFYTLQLYFDFSGYSDMAIGLGKMFGFTFLENFNYPLISKNATEFWRRWHISLGTFFRDYVYIPLGGNRHDQMRNIFIVWFLTGMWHGASWNFMLWGLYYGCLLVWEKTRLLPALHKGPDPACHPHLAQLCTFGKSLFGHVYCTLITVFGFAIFYFDKHFFANMGTLFGIGTIGFTDLFTNAIFASHIWLFIAAVILACPVYPAIDRLLHREGHTIPYTAERIAKTVLALLFLGVSTVQLVGNTYSPFLYFRF